MQKPTPNDHPIHDLIRARWSPCAYSSQPVPAADLLSVLEAARWSQSCFNDQPWFFIVTTQAQPEAFGRLVACLSEGNQRWAPRAPVLMLAVARETFAADGSPNRHAVYDLGQAVQHMILQATSLGLVARQMAGFDVAAARAAFSIPDGHQVMAAIALGYYGDPATLHEKDQAKEARPRARKALREFVFGAAWGQPAEVLGE